MILNEYIKKNENKLIYIILYDELLLWVNIKFI
jgi:hypothetical protein